VRATYTISAGVASRAAFQPQEGLRRTPGQKAIQGRPGVANPKAKEEGLWRGHILSRTPGVVHSHNKHTQTSTKQAHNTTSLQLQLHASSRMLQTKWLLLLSSSTPRIEVHTTPAAGSVGASCQLRLVADGG
jgi:hypothetical protein